MKKTYLILLAFIAMNLSAFAQTKVTFRVNMKNETVSTAGVHIPGSYQAAAGMKADWSPNDPMSMATDADNDNIYELEVTLAPGTYQYKFVNDTTWGGAENVPSGCANSGNREMVVGTNDLVLDIVCFSSCTNCASTTYSRMVKFMVVDSNSVFSDVKIKGTFSSWADLQAYDDGTNGDVTAGDKIYTAMSSVTNGTHEWGATNKGSWIIQGSNVTFSMDSVGNITGDTLYGVPKLGPLLNVIFNIDMSNEIVASEGVFVSGGFMESLENPIGNWNKDTLKMQPRTTGSDIYTLTVRLHAGKYAWRVWNGVNASDPDAPAENYDFTSNGCGEPNGVGGHNRVFDVRGASTDQILPTYVFNSCNVSASIKPLNTIKFGVKPNPAQSVANITFKNNSVNSINLVDLTGRVILSQSVQGNEVQLDLNGLSNGVYMINAFGNDGSYGVQKLIKN